MTGLHHGLLAPVEGVGYNMQIPAGGGIGNKGVVRIDGYFYPLLTHGLDRVVFITAHPGNHLFHPFFFKRT
jgi:hypothetical protein